MFRTIRSVDLTDRLALLDVSQPGDTTMELIEQLVLENSQQTRISIIIIGSFNVAAALAVLGCILFDAFTAREQVIPSRKRHVRYQAIIHRAELLPLVVSVAVILQGVVFIAVQSKGMQSVFVTGCRKTAEIVWPALWIVAYTLLVFGLETTIRSFKRTRFRKRGNWDTLICIVAVMVLITVTWVPSLLLPAQNHCLATLIWWTGHYAEIGLVLGSSLCFIYILSAAIITIQLVRTIEVDRDERIAATRTVYYLLIGVFILALTIPYFVQILMGQVALHISYMASIVVNLSGLSNGLLYLILRTNSERLAIRPADTPWSEKCRMRLFGRNDLGISVHISAPVMLKRSGNTQETLSRYSTDMKPVNNSTSVPETTVAHLETAQVPSARIPPPPKLASRQVSAKSSYSVFPKSSFVQKPSWSTIPSGRDDDIIHAPAPLFSQNYRRDFSNQSTETVHIGLRLSHTTSNNKNNNNASSASLELPIQSTPSRSVRDQSPHPSSRQSTDATSVDLLVPRTRASKPAFKSQWATKRKAPSAYNTRPHQLMKSLPPIPQIQEEVPSGLRLHPPELSDQAVNLPGGWI